MPKNPTKAFVLPVTGRDAEVQLLIDLIKAAGCEVVCEKNEHKDVNTCIAAADVIVILICPESLHNPQIDKAIETASRAGKRVAGVWAPNSKEGDPLPAAIEKYGEAVIAANQKAVKDAICGGKSDWSTPGGSPRAAPRTPRHKGK